MQHQVHSLHLQIQLTIAEKLCTNISEAFRAVQHERISEKNRWQNNENKRANKINPVRILKRGGGAQTFRYAQQTDDNPSELGKIPPVLHLLWKCSVVLLRVIVKVSYIPFSVFLLCHWAVPSLELILAKSFLVPWTPNSRYSWLLILHEYLIREEWSEIEREARKQLKAESALNDVHWMKHQYI